jgi:large subunit ribosomal protein L25
MIDSRRILMTISLQAWKRDGTNKSAAKKVRQDGFLPAVLYGRDLPKAVPIKLSVRECAKGVSKCGVGTEVNLDVEGVSYRARIQEIQKDPVSRDVIHVDFMAE